MTNQTTRYGVTITDSEGTPIDQITLHTEHDAIDVRLAFTCPQQDWATWLGLGECDNCGEWFPAATLTEAPRRNSPIFSELFCPVCLRKIERL